jgi:murein DD-endopeptidase MepM/ murein hydrolase activator NlpD
MPGPRRFNLLVVGGDGRRLLRLRVPAWALALVLGAGALVVASLGLIYGDYLALRQQRASLATLKPRLAEQQALLETYQARIREVGAEIDGWREIHARIWEPFGPEAGPATRGVGIGGGSPLSPLEAGAERGLVREELARLVSVVKEEGENLRSLERFLAKASKVLASLPSRWPLRGPINSDFGRRSSPWTSGAEFHSGMDIGAPAGTPVRAPAPGTVVYAGRHPEYGIALVIEHGNETRSLYGHLSRLHVALNQRVDRGDLVALSGNTGRSSGPHLHYEIQVKGQPVNPGSYIWE